MILNFACISQLCGERKILLPQTNQIRVSRGGDVPLFFNSSSDDFNQQSREKNNSFILCRFIIAKMYAIPLGNHLSICLHASSFLYKLFFITAYHSECTYDSDFDNMCFNYRNRYGITSGQNIPEKIYRLEINDLSYWKC